MRAEITASIMCADLLNLERDVKALEKAGVDYFHYDIMDGHFVPNMTLGLETICEIQKRVNVRSDFHLLTKEPEDIIPLLDAGENDGKNCGDDGYGNEKDKSKSRKMPWAPEPQNIKQ